MAQKITVNGVEVQPCKKVKLYELKSLQEIEELIRKKREEQNGYKPSTNQG